MQHSRLALLFAASVLSGVAVLVACDSDNGTVPLPGGGTTSGNASSSSGRSTSGAVEDDDTADDDDTTDDDDDTAGDAGCKNLPTLHTTTNGFFCGFYDGGTSTEDAGGKKNCGNTQVCCNPGKDGNGKFPNSYCTDDDPKGDGPGACANVPDEADSQWIPGTAWECASSTNCGGKKCCAKSFDDAVDGGFVNVGNDTNYPKSCNAKALYKVNGTRCATSCTEGKELELCSKNDGCSGGKTCVPVSANGDRDLGVCQ
jgi:hypothetical protein